MESVDETYFLLMKMCKNVIKSEIKPELAFSQFSEKQKSRPDLSAMLLDVLQSIDTELCESATAEERNLFKELCKLCANSLIPEDMLRLNIESFYQEDSLNQRYNKVRTKAYYKQLKFNLLREESEGYGKLIVELNQEISPPFDAQTALERIRCLIGQFNLDPNRVLDVILECFESRLDQRNFFVDLLKLYKSTKENICNVLGFKFTFYQARFKCKAHVPESLYRLTALLLYYEFLDLSILMTYLVPKVDDYSAEQLKLRERAIEKGKIAQRIGSATVADNTDSDSQNEPVAASSIFVYDLETLDNEDENALLSENQKLGLLLALVETGCWPLIKQMFERTPDYFAVSSSRRICLALIDLVDRNINPLYDSKCPEMAQYSTEVKRWNVDDSIFVADMNQVKSWKQLVDYVFPILEYLGPNLGLSPHVMVKLVRLLTVFCKEKSSTRSSKNLVKLENESLYKAVVEICDISIVPAITLLEGNCAISEEVWGLVGQFQYTTRYMLYGRWKRDHTCNHPSLLLRKGLVTGKTRYVMKRLSKETIRLVGRQLGKLCHVHPGIVFDMLLEQIQTFENLIGPVVESVRYMSSLEFDVLSYCIIEHLASPAKQKLKVSDATLSPWLQSLATFVGTAFKKYNMELTAVLQYVANQLKAGNSVDLLVLKEVVQNMSGIETTTALTQDQLEALSGGDMLRQEGGQFGQVRNVKRATNRLKDALFQEDLVVSLCILTAQQRGSIVFKEGEGLHLKLVGQMLDQCQETLVQFGNFLLTNLKSEDYSKRMPSACALIGEHHLPLDAAMFLARPIYTEAIAIKYEELKKLDRTSSKATVSPERKTVIYCEAFKKVIDALGGEIEKLCPNVQLPDCKLLTTFWTLTNYDLTVPVAAYEREIDKIHKSIEQVEQSRELSDSKRRKEKDRLLQTETKLKDEQRRQQDHVNRVMEMLKSAKDQWFLENIKNTNKQSLMNSFFQWCILLRCTFTESDSIYCARFIEVLHSLKTASFLTIAVYDRVYGNSAKVIPSLSENEAHFYGRFLCSCLEITNRWHRNRSVFDKECSGYPGLFMKHKKLSNDEMTDRMEYEDYRDICFKWHTTLARGFMSLLDGGKYMGIRCALIVLLKILPQYPIIINHFNVIEARVRKVRDEEKDKRLDLHVLAASYWGQLKVRKVPEVVADDQFHLKSAKTVKKTPNLDTSAFPSANSSTISIKQTVEPNTVVNKKIVITAKLDPKSKPDVKTVSAVDSEQTVNKPEASPKPLIRNKETTKREAVKEPAKKEPNKETTKREAVKEPAKKEPNKETTRKELTKAPRSETKTATVSVDEKKKDNTSSQTSKSHVHLKRPISVSDSTSLPNSEVKKRKEESKSSTHQPGKTSETAKLPANQNAEESKTTGPAADSAGSRKIRLPSKNEKQDEQATKDEQRITIKEERSVNKRNDKTEKHLSKDHKEGKTDQADSSAKTSTKRVVVEPSTSNSTKSNRIVVEPSEPSSSTCDKTSPQLKAPRKIVEEPIKQRTSSSTPQSDKSDASSTSAKRGKRIAQVNGTNSSESKRTKRSRKDHAESGHSSSRSGTPSTRTPKHTSKERERSDESDHKARSSNREHTHKSRSASRDKERKSK